MLTSLWSGEELFKYDRKSENHYRKDKDICVLKYFKKFKSIEQAEENIGDTYVRIS